MNHILSMQTSWRVVRNTNGTVQLSGVCDQVQVRKLAQNHPMTGLPQDSISMEKAFPKVKTMF